MAEMVWSRSGGLLAGFGLAAYRYCQGWSSCLYVSELGRKERLRAFRVVVCRVCVEFVMLRVYGLDLARTRLKLQV